jgi:2-polyprenyl-6-methoxyphenol hydroxylase-like FAD-dependent oxidoreductase
MQRPAGEHAVVLGAGIAGLVTARVLSEMFAHVTIVERDPVALESGTRRGVPQGHHVHGLLARGQQVLEELFPGITADLERHGAPCGDALGDARLILNGHRLRRAHSGLVAISASRGLLESTIRTRVTHLPTVEVLPGADAVGLLGSSSARRVTGVRVLRRAPGSAEEKLTADLVVDATGRTSRLAAWLSALGHRSPPQERVTLELTYTSRRYHLADHALGGDLACITGPTAQRPRGGALTRLEGGVWLLTLFGFHGHNPPRDLEGFLAFARSLETTDIGDAVVTGAPIDEPSTFRFPAGTRCRYEHVPCLPNGVLPIGDSMCSFNPIYGQGMTVAALQALRLRRHGPNLVTGTFQVVSDLASVIGPAWDMALGADLMIPGVRGPRPLKLRLAARYVDRAQVAASRSEVAAQAFVRVTGLVDPPASLLRPRTALTVLRHGKRTVRMSPADGEAPKLEQSEAAP